MPKKGVVLPLGATGDFDDSTVYYSSSIFYNNYFFIYYTGYDGTNYFLGLAISKDGINFIKKGIVLPLGAAGEIDTFATGLATVIYINNYFYLYYSAHNGLNARTSLAISKDGINFIKKGVVIPLGAANEFDSSDNYPSSVLYFNNHFYLYYYGIDSSTLLIALAISKDGINFINKGVVITVGATGDFDYLGVFNPNVLFKDGFFYCYYSAYDGTNYRVGLALSKDGINFIKKGVVITVGSTGQFDDLYAFNPNVFYKDGYFYSYYSGNDGTNERIGIALSTDGINFI